MQMKLQVASCRLQAARQKPAVGGIFNLQPSTFNLRGGFTLIELLVVISILGILAGLSVPALKNLGKSNVQVSASRQLLDDLGHARQLAVSQRTTVYMVFVPANFWTFNPTWWSGLPAAQITAGANLLDKQLTGYNFLSLRSVGDQPGQSSKRYLSEWKSLPDGAFIATNKFNTYYLNSYYSINDSASGASYPIYSFGYTNLFPFPTETNAATFIALPYVAFNCLGQLTVDGVNPANRDEFIPLAQGTVAYAADANKNLTFNPANFSENPTGNSTNSMFNLIRIDHLTGRAVQVQQKVQ